jgi:hypothetical protein
MFIPLYFSYYYVFHDDPYMDHILLEVMLSTTYVLCVFVSLSDVFDMSISELASSLIPFSYFAPYFCASYHYSD